MSLCSVLGIVLEHIQLCMSLTMFVFFNCVRFSTVLSVSVVVCVYPCCIL